MKISCVWENTKIHPQLFYGPDLNIAKTKVNQQLMENPFLLNRQIFDTHTHSHNQYVIEWNGCNVGNWNSDVREIMHDCVLTWFICIRSVASFSRKSAFISYQIHDAKTFQLNSSLGFFFKKNSFWKDPHNRYGSAHEWTLGFCICFFLLCVSLQ